MKATVGLRHLQARIDVASREAQKTLFTGVRGRGILGSSALIGFCELRLMRVLRSLLVVGVPSSIKITSST